MGRLSVLGSLLLLLVLLVCGSDGFLVVVPQPSSPPPSPPAPAAAAALTRMQALRPFHPTATGAPSEAMPLMDSHRIKAHGRHICLDYTGFFVEAQQGAEATLQAIRAAVSDSGVREVHSRIVVLGEDGLSPPGFTGVCLVDESHVTAHCYSDRGWLAIDVFTCGAHPPEVRYHDATDRKEGTCFLYFRADVSFVVLSCLLFRHALHIAQDIARGVHARLLAAVPGLHLVRGATLDRFLHHDLVNEEEEEEALRAGGGGGVAQGKEMAEAAK